MSTNNSIDLFKDFLGKDVKSQRSYVEIEKLYKILESIIESSYDAICVNDSKGMGMIANEAYTRITGIKREDLIGKNLQELIDDGIISESVTFKVIKEKKITTIIQNIRGKELLSTGTPIYDEKGELTHVVTNMRDITDLNKLKAELYQTKELSKIYLDKVEEINQQKEFAHLGGVTRSKEVGKVLRLIDKVSNVNSTVFIYGESGVGKELFANMIHHKSNRAKNPYVKVNCAAIPEHLLESELFGYDKGAFTGANKEGKPGYFEQAHTGTIFLDEIGEMPLDLQSKILRVLQEHEIMRVGGTKSIKVDVRIISATNIHLEELVKEKKFREDLFYRLYVVPINIPALRERKVDIPPLAYFFLNNMNEKYDLTMRFQPEVIRQFESYDWPGNIREMENLIERLVVTSDSSEITLDSLPDIFFTNNLSSKKSTLKELVEEVERNKIIETMKEFKTTRQAAKVLGISQSTLVKKMQKLNLSVNTKNE